MHAHTHPFPLPTHASFTSHTKCHTPYPSLLTSITYTPHPPHSTPTQPHTTPLPPKPTQIQSALERVRAGADVMPRSQLEGQLVAELGRDWSNSLASFDFTPRAAASIGQVHAAQMHDGTQVAMKIQYPGTCGVHGSVWRLGVLLVGLCRVLWVTLLSAFVPCCLIMLFSLVHPLLLAFSTLPLSFCNPTLSHYPHSLSHSLTLALPPPPTNRRCPQHRE